LYEKDVSLWLGKARFLMKLKEYQKADACYDKIGKINPEFKKYVDFEKDRFIRMSPLRVK
jgi:tetratricopeptide (TPR) repeat protein